MMLMSNRILGPYDGMTPSIGSVDYIEISWTEAGKRQLRRRTEGGTDLALSMKRGSYLYHGAIVFKSSDHVIVVSRPRERALIIRLDEAREPVELMRCALLIGHLFGNQHIPIEVEGGAIRVPVLTSEDQMTQAIGELGLSGLSLQFDDVQLGASQPLATSHHAH